MSGLCKRHPPLRRSLTVQSKKPAHCFLCTSYLNFSVRLFLWSLCHLWDISSMTAVTQGLPGSPAPETIAVQRLCWLVGDRTVGGGAPGSSRGSSRDVRGGHVPGPSGGRAAATRAGLRNVQAGSRGAFPEVGTVGGGTSWGAEGRGRLPRALSAPPTAGRSSRWTVGPWRGRSPLPSGVPVCWEGCSDNSYFRGRGGPPAGVRVVAGRHLFRSGLPALRARSFPTPGFGP